MASSFLAVTARDSRLVESQLGRELTFLAADGVLSAATLQSRGYNGITVQMTMRFSVGHLNNAEIIASTCRRRAKDQENPGCAVSDTCFMVFIPFSLYRKHRIWNFKDKSCPDQSDALRSHIQWLETRLALFDQFTLAGLERSGMCVFELHVFIDEYEEQPWLAAWVARNIRSMTSTRGINASIHKVGLYPQPEPYFSYPAVLAHLVCKIARTAKGSSKRVALIRLDGDDTLMPDYMSIIDEYLYAHEIANKEEYLLRPTLIDMPLGIQYRKETGEAWKCLWPESNFTTLIVKTEDISPSLVPFAFAHDEVPCSVNKNVLATQSPMWIQGIHDGNQANDVFKWATRLATVKSIGELLADSDLTR